MNRLLVSLFVIFYTMNGAMGCKPPPFYHQLQEKFSDQYLQEEIPQWYKSDRPLAIVLLAHGLNIKSSTFKDVINLFLNHQFSVFKIALAGHRGSFEEKKSVTPEIWKQEFDYFICQASQEADLYKVPLILIGHSLGSLLVTLADDSNVIMKILLAPPFALKWYTSFLYLSPYLPQDLLIPSFNKNSYTVEDGTLVREYRSMMTLRDQALKKMDQLSSSYILIDRDDEFISSQSLKKKFHSIQIHWIELSSTPSPHHLIVDKESMGVEGWKQFENIFLWAARGANEKESMD